MGLWLTILLSIVAIGLVWCIAKHKLIQGFVDTMESVIVAPGCPNYFITDGNKYYLVFNHLSFDGINNPLAFDSLAAARIELQRRGCPGMEPFYLRRETNHTDPVESYERSCAKHVANPLFWLNDCAFGISYSDSGLEPVEPEAANLDPAILAKRKARALEFIKTGEGDKFKLLRQLSDFLNSQDTATQVDYDIETCMIDRLGKDMPELGGPEALQKYNKYFNTSYAQLNGSKKLNNQIADVDSIALAELDNYLREAQPLSS